MKKPWTVFWWNKYMYIYTDITMVVVGDDMVMGMVGRVLSKVENIIRIRLQVNDN